MSPRRHAFGIASLILALAAGLAGCTTTSTTTANGSTVPVDETKPADAARRAQLRMELASSYFANGQASTALDEVNEVLKIDPQRGDAYNLRGLIYASLNDDARAEASFRRALEINPRDAETMHNFGWYQCQRQHYAEAAALFDQALATPQYRDVVRTLLAQGVCQARAGRNAEAERSLMRAYEIDAGNPAIAVNLAEVLLRNGEYERARFYVRRVNARPELVTAQTLWLAARIEKRLGNAQGVREFGNQLRNRFPQSREAQDFDSGRFDE